MKLTNIPLEKIMHQPEWFIRCTRCGSKITGNNDRRLFGRAIIEGWKYEPKIVLYYAVFV